MTYQCQHGHKHRPLFHDSDLPITCPHCPITQRAYWTKVAAKAVNPS